MVYHQTQPFTCSGVAKLLTVRGPSADSHWATRCIEVTSLVERHLGSSLLAGEPIILTLEDFVFIGRRRRAMLQSAKLVAWLLAALSYRLKPIHVQVYTPSDWRSKLQNLPSRLYDRLAKNVVFKDQHQADAFGVAATVVSQLHQGELHVL